MATAIHFCNGKHRNLDAFSTLAQMILCATPNLDHMRFLDDVMIFYEFQLDDEKHIQGGFKNQPQQLMGTSKMGIVNLR